MTFEEFKQECINRQKNKEINQYLHLYIKASSYADILQIVKTADQFEWSFANGIIDMALINEIPEIDREAANVYTGSISLTDINSNTIYVLEGGNLSLTQTGQNRCKVILMAAQMVGNASGESMIEVESLMSSDYDLNSSDNAYLHVTNKHNSTCRINATNESIVKLNGWNISMTTILLEDDAFLNAVLNDSCHLEHSISENKKIRRYQKSTASEITNETE